MSVLKEIDTQFIELLENKRNNNAFWCGYSLAMFQISINKAYTHEYITMEQSDYLFRCGNYASIYL